MARNMPVFIGTEYAGIHGTEYAGIHGTEYAGIRSLRFTPNPLRHTNSLQ